MSLNFLYTNESQGHHTGSYYFATAENITDYPALEDDLEVDVCIIGAGFTGLSSALHLAKLGYKPVVLEAHRAGWGASGRNGGQVSNLQRIDQPELEKQVGKTLAGQALEIAQQAHDKVVDLIKEYQIPAHYQSGLIYPDHKTRYVEPTRQYVQFMQDQYGRDDIEFVAKDEMRELVASDYYHGGLINHGGGHIHPLNFALGLAKAAEKEGATIYEKTEALEIVHGDPAIIKTGYGKIKAKYVIIACNAYLGSLEPKLATQIMPVNNFIIATEPMTDDEKNNLIQNNYAVADSRFVVNYYRFSQDNRLLFGGGERYSYNFPPDIKNFVRPYMLQIFPQLEDIAIDYGWGGTLAITRKRHPYLASLAPNILTGCGYSGNGVALATKCGEILALAINGTASQFDVMKALPTPRFPGTSFMRWPMLILAMSYYTLLDRI